MNISQGYSSGGSVNSAQSYSQTNATDARAWSENAATTAFNRQKELMQMQMDYNAAEAQKARDWEANMANTVYTRSVNNMREAGINPILAANMGLSGAAVGSGATASISGGSAPLAQNFMDSSSASSSNGSSWNNSENGFATGLKALGEALAAGLGAINSGLNLDLNLGALGNLDIGKEIKGAIGDLMQGNTKITDVIGDIQGSKGVFTGSSKHIKTHGNSSGKF